MSSTFKPTPRPEAAGLQGYEARLTGDEFGLKGGIHFYFEDAGGSVAGDRLVEQEDLLQDVQEAIDALHTAIWSRAKADNPDLDASPKAKRREARRVAREAERAARQAEREAEQAARQAEREAEREAEKAARQAERQAEREAARAAEEEEASDEG